MARKLDLSSFETLLRQGNDFEVTEEQYENDVQKEMPKTYYLRTTSPVATLAKKYGYQIQIVERIHRVLIFTKQEGI